MTITRDLRVVRLGCVHPVRLASASRSALDRPLASAAELTIGIPNDHGVTLGAMQRWTELAPSALGDAIPFLRRGSGGSEALVGPGSVWVQLALSDPSVLFASPPSRLLNRYVRPLLRALSSGGMVARYFDRDWVSGSNGRLRGPIASVSFGHDSASRRCLVEALVSVTTPFATRERVSFLGQPPQTMQALAGTGSLLDVEKVADAVVLAYRTAFAEGGFGHDTDLGEVDELAEETALGARVDPPWLAVREEAIGIVAAGPDGDGRLRLGGEFMASRDVVGALEREVARLWRTGDTSRDSIARAVASLGASDAALLGVRSLTSIVDVILEVVGASAR